MMGQVDFEIKLFRQLSRDRLVPQVHLLLRIAEAVDYSFVRPPCRPVIFTMPPLGYLYGSTSVVSRRRQMVVLD